MENKPKYKFMSGVGWVEIVANPTLYIQENFSEEEAGMVLEKRFSTYDGYPDITARAKLHAMSRKQKRAIIYLIEKPLEEMPLYVGHSNVSVREIASWRLKIGK